MTERRNRRRRSTGGLKLLLLSASFLATIGGERLLAAQEATQSAADTQQVTLDRPAPILLFDSLAAPARSATIELKPIPQAMVPHINPVARARSSM